MGGMYNSSLRQAPQGGVLIYTQPPSMCSCTASWNQTSKPKELATVQDAVWSEFSQTVEGLCKKIKAEYLMFLPFPLLIVGVLVQVAGPKDLRMFGFIFQFLVVLAV